MNNVSIDIHCDDQTIVSSAVHHSDSYNVDHRVLRLEQIVDGITTAQRLSVFLTEEAARAIHDELKRIYPKLALPLGVSNVDALAEQYAEEHAGDVGADGPVEIEHIVNRGPDVPTSVDVLLYNARVVDLVARAAGLIR